MKKDGVNINIHLTNRVMYSLIALSLILIVGVGVYAFGGNDPSYVGHSAGELDGLGTLASKDSVDWSEITDKPIGLSEDLPTCSGTQKLTFNGTDVICANDYFQADTNSYCSVSSSCSAGFFGCGNIEYSINCPGSSISITGPECGGGCGE